MNTNLNDFSLDMFRLDGKVALVTGGNTGMGQAYAVALAKAGADIMIHAHSERNVKETIKLIEKAGRKAKYVLGDLRDKNSVDKIVAECIKQYGKIDILVNNAGTIRRSPLIEYKEQDWKETLDVNLNAVYFLSQAAAKYMVKQKSGKIINVASMLSFQGGKFVPAYTASKHGVAGLTKAFANELASSNIQINAIAPGYIATANTAPIRSDAERSKEILSRIPAGRWGYPYDVMGAVVFLSSKASDYVNGHILAVDGGWLVR